MAVTEAKKPSLLERAQEIVRREKEDSAIKKLVDLERQIEQAKKVVQNFEMQRELLLKDIEA